MSKEENKNETGKTREEIHIPDFAELWKEIYFKTESVWSDVFREYVKTQSFVNFLDKNLEQYLAGSKVVQENLDKYMEHNPFASKKDIARVAELVISLENKLDDMEYELVRNMNSVAESLLRMLALQEKMQVELAALKYEINTMKKDSRSNEEKSGEGEEAAQKPVRSRKRRPGSIPEP